jgi:carbamoyltransferase
MKKNYIGLSLTPHDPAIAIINSEGEVVFAEATERYLQNKRAWNCQPDDLIRIKFLIEHYCDMNAEFVLAASWKPISLLKAEYFNLIFKLFCNHPFQGQFALINLHKTLKSNIDNAGLNLSWQAKNLIQDVKLSKRYYPHHSTHAAAGCYASPYDEAVCFVVDGMGENLFSTAKYHYKNGSLTSLDTLRPINSTSLGFFYDLICNTCGFDPIQGEEWKVMGLASYGKFDDSFYKLLQKLICVHKGYVVMPKGSKKVMWEIAAMQRKPHEPALDWANIAYTAQQYYCELLAELLNSLHCEKLSDNLVLAGGCALNSSANGIILDNTRFKNLFVSSAPADDGNALGAAYLAFKEDHPEFVPPTEVLTPYLGSTLKTETIQRYIDYGGFKPTPLDGKTIHAKTAELLAQGKLIAWVQGRAEYGSRALGNRSILADPRDERVKDRLNLTVKFREEFRPFAPSILHEHGNEYFENYQESPYMERTLKFKQEVMAKVPGVVHIDGTGRLQSVKREWNPDYYELIAEFNKLTEIPMLLNTSFNVMGKPIVHSVEDAFTVFNSSGLDALIINDMLFEKPHSQDRYISI